MNVYVTGESYLFDVDANKTIPTKIKSFVLAIVIIMAQMLIEIRREISNFFQIPIFVVKIPFIHHFPFPVFPLHFFPGAIMVPPAGPGFIFLPIGIMTFC